MRRNWIYVTSPTKNLKLVDQYLANGSIFTSFKPTSTLNITNYGEFWQNVNNQSNYQVEGLIKFSIEGTSNYLLIYFLSSWDSDRLAAACISPSNVDSKEVLNKIRPATLQYSPGWYTYNIGYKYVKCMGVDFKK